MTASDRSAVRRWGSFSTRTINPVLLNTGPMLAMWAAVDGGFRCSIGVDS